MKVQVAILCLTLLASCTAGEYVLKCTTNELGVLWPHYDDMTTYYQCLNIGEPAVMKCNAGTVFTYVYQSCTLPQDYIPPPPLRNLPTDAPSFSTIGSTPDTTTARPSTTTKATTLTTKTTTVKTTTVKTTTPPTSPVTQTPATTTTFIIPTAGAPTTIFTFPTPLRPSTTPVSTTVLTTETTTPTTTTLKTSTTPKTATEKTTKSTTIKITTPTTTPTTTIGIGPPSPVANPDIPMPSTPAPTPPVMDLSPQTPSG